jgi:hypothetical protein
MKKNRIQNNAGLKRNAGGPAKLKRGSLRKKNKSFRSNLRNTEGKRGLQRSHRGGNKRRLGGPNSKHNTNSTGCQRSNHWLT